MAKPTCVACGDTGLNSKGNPCVPCQTRAQAQRAGRKAPTPPPAPAQKRQRSPGKKVRRKGGGSQWTEQKLRQRANEVRAVKDVLDNMDWKRRFMLMHRVKLAAKNLPVSGDKHAQIQRVIVKVFDELSIEAKSILPTSQVKLSKALALVNHLLKKD